MLQSCGVHVSPDHAFLLESSSSQGKGWGVGGDLGRHLTISREMVMTEDEVLLASSGGRLRMLIKTPKCIRQSPAVNKHPAQNVNSATVEKAYFRENIENNIIYRNNIINIYFHLFTEKVK